VRTDVSGEVNNVCNLEPEPSYQVQSIACQPVFRRKAPIQSSGSANMPRWSKSHMEQRVHKATDRHGADVSLRQMP
jgi:hypothetical protein